MCSTTYCTSKHSGSLTKEGKLDHLIGRNRTSRIERLSYKKRKKELPMTKELKKEEKTKKSINYGDQSISMANGGVGKVERSSPV